MQDSAIEALTTRRRLTMARLTDAQSILAKLGTDRANLIASIERGERGAGVLLENLIVEITRQRDTVTALETELGEIERDLEQAQADLQRRQREAREKEWNAALGDLIKAYEHVAGPAQRVWELIDSRSMMVNEQDWRHLPDRGGWIRLNGTAVKIGGGQ